MNTFACYHTHTKEKWHKLHPVKTLYIQNADHVCTGGFITIETTATTTMWMKSFMNMLKLSHFNRFKSNFPQYTSLIRKDTRWRERERKRHIQRREKRKYEKVLMRCFFHACSAYLTWGFSLSKKFPFFSLVTFREPKRKMKSNLSIWMLLCSKFEDSKKVRILWKWKYLQECVNLNEDMNTIFLMKCCDCG